MRRRLAFLGAVLLAGIVTSVVVAGPPGPTPNLGHPVILRLQGVIEQSADAAKGKGFTVTSLGFQGADTQRWLAVTKARTTGGDPPLDGKDVLADAAPYTPNFLVAGPEQVIARLRDAPPDTEVQIEGIVTRGSRTYHLRRVERGAA